jgi:hypothetical protein
MDVAKGINVRMDRDICRDGGGGAGAVGFGFCSDVVRLYTGGYSMKKISNYH